MEKLQVRFDAMLRATLDVITSAVSDFQISNYAFELGGKIKKTITRNRTRFCCER